MAATERARQMRRRVLTLQLSRLAGRAGAADAAARDAASRAVRVASRLERDELYW
ncbi:hypothetical protein [Trujillonella humicola]|uniref:hypothetical protein n=1 Tax=Trujillonella humicola TaxID=3383699 RepID=UPI0039064C21